MPSHSWVVARLANLHWDKGQTVLACNPNYDQPDRISGCIPDVYVKTIGRLYEVKNDIADMKQDRAITQFKAFREYPKARSFNIVLCQDMDMGDKKECYRILRKNYINEFKVLEWREALDKI